MNFLVSHITGMTIKKEFMKKGKQKKKKKERKTEEKLLRKWKMGKWKALSFGNLKKLEQLKSFNNVKDLKISNHSWILSEF